MGRVRVARVGRPAGARRQVRAVRGIVVVGTAVLARRRHRAAPWAVRWARSRPVLMLRVRRRSPTPNSHDGRAVLTVSGMRLGERRSGTGGRFANQGGAGGSPRSARAGGTTAVAAPSRRRRKRWPGPILDARSGRARRHAGGASRATPSAATVFMVGVDRWPGRECLRGRGRARRLPQSGATRARRKRRLARLAWARSAWRSLRS